MPDKNTIRKIVLEKRDSLTSEILERSGTAAAEKLALRQEYANANTVMVYMDFRNEVPTGSIIEQIRASEKQLVLPYTDQEFNIIAYEIPKQGNLSDYLVTSRFGIAEPNPVVCREADLSSIDLVVVPGTVFDLYENRIGYGKGCYDKFFSVLPGHTFKLALAYDFQVLQCIPADPTDVKMDSILTINTALFVCD